MTNSQKTLCLLESQGFCLTSLKKFFDFFLFQYLFYRFLGATQFGPIVNWLIMTKVTYNWLKIDFLSVLMLPKSDQIFAIKSIDSTQ